MAWANSAIKLHGAAAWKNMQGLWNSATVPLDEVFLIADLHQKRWLG